MGYFPLNSQEKAQHPNGRAAIVCFLSTIYFKLDQKIEKLYNT